MKTIVFFLEEPSAREMLEGVLPRVIPPEAMLKIDIQYRIFRGKQDLEKNLVKRLREWQRPRSVFVIMRDQDAGDCIVVKQKLVDLCRQSGKHNVLVRVACHELESFYLGDLRAVESGLKLSGVSLKQNHRKSRIIVNSGHQTISVIHPRNYSS